MERPSFCVDRPQRVPAECYASIRSIPKDKLQNVPKAWPRSRRLRLIVRVPIRALLVRCPATVRLHGCPPATNAEYPFDRLRNDFAVLLLFFG